MGRAGRFGTKGLAISFVSTDQDKDVLQQIEKRFEVALPYVLPFPLCCLDSLLTLRSEFPAEGIDASTYMAS